MGAVLHTTGPHSFHKALLECCGLELITEMLAVEKYNS